MIRAGFYAAILCILAASATAQTVLTVTHDGETIEYDMAALQALPQTEYTTTNAFIDGSKVFSGPLLRDVLKLSNSFDEKEVMMRAINNYEITLPVSDSIDYDVIIATQMDGALMSIREKGPLWLMYPFSEFPELDDSVYKGRIIWQLVNISTK
tara:strand:- start:167 stop:628 length:462 start_codon:yes stop_codon:yes gene_type:complete